MPEEVTSGDIVNYVSASILSGPEDDVWDNIRDWILSAQSTIIRNINSYLEDKIAKTQSRLLSEIIFAETYLGDPIREIRSWVFSLKQDVVRVLEQLWQINKGGGSGIAGIITSITSGIADIISAPFRAVSDALTKILPAISNAVTSIITTLGNTIATTFSSVVRTITTALSSIMTTISTFFSSIMTTIMTTISALATEVRTSIDWLANFILVKIPGYIEQGIKKLLDLLMDFATWIPRLFASIFDWATEEVPGSSPRGEGILATIFHWIVNAFKSVMEWFATYILKPIISALVEILSAIADIFRPVTQVVFDGIMTFLSKLGPLAPEGATGAISGLANIGLIIVGMLGAMTVAGHLIHPFQTVGLGEVSAMVWDMSQFSVITGAFMGVVAALAIRIPLTYYLNKSLRPRLPDERSIMSLAGEYAIDKAKFMEVMPFFGYSDYWCDRLYELADRPEGYFFLRAAAEQIEWDEEWMRASLMNTGYRMATVEKAMVAFRRMATGQSRGMMSGYAITRFKEGFSTEEQFTEELRLLRYSEEEIPIYIAAGKLAFATDYLTDLVNAYHTAATKGHISLDEYRQVLLGFGMVPNRVEARVLRARAQLRPKEKLTPLSPPTPVYETDAGKIQVDTIRDKRKLEVISRDEEIASLLELGMGTDLATAYADNDDVYLTKEELPPVPVPMPAYQTEAGKVEVETIRRQRRKKLIPREDEIASLLKLEMDMALATATANNDDVRLAEKGGEE